VVAAAAEEVPTPVAVVTMAVDAVAPV